MTVTYIGAGLYVGVNADTKPTTGVATNAVFYETDTGRWMRYNGSSWVVGTVQVYNNQANAYTAVAAGNQTFKDNQLVINNPAGGVGYIFRTSAIAASRDITLPLLTGADSFVFAAHTQTLSNKTLTTPTINGETQADASKTTTYTITATDTNIRADATSAGFTVTLPTAASIAGRVYRIKKIDSTTNVVVVDGNGSETIDGLLTWELRNPFDFVEVKSDGTNWNVVDFNVPSFNTYYRKGTTENRWYIAGMTGAGTLLTGALTANQLYALPYVVSSPITVNDMAINVTTAGAALTVARIGIYKDKNVYPSELVVEAGEVATSNTNTFQSTALGTPQKLQPGLYWFVIVASGTPTVRTIPVANVHTIWGINNTAATTQPNVVWAHSFTYAALPATFPDSSPILGSAPPPCIYARLV